MGKHIMIAKIFSNIPTCFDFVNFFFTMSQKKNLLTYRASLSPLSFDNPPNSQSTRGRSIVRSPSTRVRSYSYDSYDGTVYLGLRDK